MDGELEVGEGGEGEGEILWSLLGDYFSPAFVIGLIGEMLYPVVARTQGAMHR